MLNIQATTADERRMPVLALGFRPFFIAAAAYGLLAMLLWSGVYLFNLQLLPSALPPVSWHAHEMIFGYSMAVIAGFLLTAVRNWTGIQTLNGAPLLWLVLLWALPRLLPLLHFSGVEYLLAALDVGFVLVLLPAVVGPIIKARQWRQAGIAAKLLLLGAANACFYAGIFGWYADGVQIGLYAGFYLLIALILTMGRRLIPFFTERGVGYAVTLVNRSWLDIASMVLLLLFLVMDVFAGAKQVAAALALALFVLHSIRLIGWFTAGIRRYPLLWSLHAAYAFIVLGFLLYAAAVYHGLSPFLSVHAFAVGGIGVITVAMMARVSLGHTGRNVHQPPRAVGYLLLLLVMAAVVRVLLPLLSAEYYRLWIACSQILWVLGFAGFLLIYLPILMRPRIDGQPG